MYGDIEVLTGEIPDVDLITVEVKLKVSVGNPRVMATTNTMETRQERKTKLNGMRMLIKAVTEYI